MRRAERSRTTGDGDTAMPRGHAEMIILRNKRDGEFEQASGAMDGKANVGGKDKLDGPREGFATGYHGCGDAFDGAAVFVFTGDAGGNGAVSGLTRLASWLLGGREEKDLDITLTSNLWPKNAYSRNMLD